MATILTVGDGDLVRTDWGNSVAAELNGNVVKRTANQTMAGELTVNDTIRANNFVVLQDPATAADHATRKDYVDAQVADVRDDSVAVTGDTMTGILNVGNVPTSSNDGLQLRTDGLVYSVVTTGTATGLPNMIMCRTGTLPEAVTGRFVRFERTAAGTDIGSIAIASASSVAYNTTSDPRLKQTTGDADDAATIAHDLGAKAFRGRWIADQGQGEEWVFLNSTDIEAVAPFAVTGAAGAVINGEIEPQQVNYPSLVPLLFAALSQALDRIAAFEAA